MAAGSSIEWTQATWNPVTGCTRVSAGCDHCYAARMTHRLEKMGCGEYRGLTSRNRRGDMHFNGVIRCHDDRLAIPGRWRQARFQILTKRPERAAEVAPRLTWSPNIWMGTSVENMLVSHRIKDLTRIPAQVRFLSLEPLLGPLPRLALTGIHWVIVGGESGPGCRPMEESWVTQIRDRCVAQGVPFFFKQWGGVNKKKNGRLLEGRTWDELANESRGRGHTHVRIATA
jgi:protein gp37